MVWLVLALLAGLAVGFLFRLSVNFLRELLAFGLVSLVARFSPWAAIALCGATAADTTLPLLAKATNAQGAFTGLISGGFITASVPLLVTLLFIGLGDPSISAGAVSLCQFVILPLVNVKCQFGKVSDDSFAATL